MKHFLTILSIPVLLLSNNAAFAQNNVEANFLDASEMVQMRDQKPWSFNMGISNIEAAERFPQITSNSTAKRGRGVTLSLQRKLTNQFEMGMSFTSYKMKNVGKSTWAYSSPDETENYANINEIYGELQPIQLSLYGGTSFTAAAFGGFASRIDSGTVSTLFYGIGAGLDFKRQMGVRLDLKTLISWGNINTLSLVGYF